MATTWPAWWCGQAAAQPHTCPCWVKILHLSQQAVGLKPAVAAKKPAAVPAPGRLDPLELENALKVHLCTPGALAACM